MKMKNEQKHNSPAYLMA